MSLIYVPLMSYSIGLAWMMNAIVVDISRDLSLFNVDFEPKHQKQQQQSSLNNDDCCTKMLERFVHVIKEFSVAKQLSLRKAVMETWKKFKHLNL